MGEVRVQTQIAASPQAVWAVLSDLDRWADWNAVIVDGHTRGGQGASVRCKVAVGPVWFPVRSRLETWEDARELAWGEDRGRLVRIRHGMALEPVDGGTRLSHYERFEGALGRLIFPLVDRPLTRTYTAFNAALKARIEGA